MPRPYRIEVLVDAPAAAVHDRIGRWCTVEEVDADHSRIHMTADSLEWPILALGAVEADFHVVAPPELRTQLHSWAARFTRA